jgi:hypothetical protein
MHASSRIGNRKPSGNARTWTQGWWMKNKRAVTATGYLVGKRITVITRRTVNLILVESVDSVFQINMH